MKVTHLIAIAALTLGCATGYQPSGFTGGYSETKLNERVYEIEFRGNGYTGSSTTRNYARRRGAELTVKSGYTHFVELGGQTEVDTSLAYYNNQPQLVNKPGSNLRIYMLTEEQAAEVPTAIDATMLLCRYEGPAWCQKMNAYLARERERRAAERASMAVQAEPPVPAAMPAAVPAEPPAAPNPPTAGGPAPNPF